MRSQLLSTVAQICAAAQTRRASPSPPPAFPAMPAPCPPPPLSRSSSPPRPASSRRSATRPPPSACPRRSRSPAASRSRAAGPRSGAPISSSAAPPGCWPGSPNSAPCTSPSSTSAPARSPGPTPCAPTCRSASRPPPAPRASTTPAPPARRIATAIRETLGAPVPDDPPDDALTLKVRIDDDLCTISVDTSGEPLHRRGHKQAVNAAPMRETLAALFLRACGYTGAEPVLDPMCGSGTFVIEAAEIAAGLAPGRSRAFAFERLATFDPAAWSALQGRRPAAPDPHPLPRQRPRRRRHRHEPRQRRPRRRRGTHRLPPGPVSDLARPDGPPGLVIVNPPYGARLGDAALRPLYAALGAILRRGSPAGASASSPPSPRSPTPRAAVRAARPAGAAGPLRIRLWQTGPL